MLTDLFEVMMYSLRADLERATRLKRQAAERVYNMAADACGFTYADYDSRKLLNREGKPLTPADKEELDAKLVNCEAEYNRLVEEGNRRAKEAREADEARREAIRKAANDLAAAPWREARIKRKLEAINRRKGN